MAQACSHGHEILLNMEQFLKAEAEFGSRKKKVQDSKPAFESLAKYIHDYSSIQ
jgi:hypothetical protein